jgi:hypothetical protein
MNVCLLRRRAAALLAVALLLATLAGCAAVAPPSNSSASSWSPDQANMPTAEFTGDIVTVHNVRNCSYKSSDDFNVEWQDRQYDLNKIRSVDFIVVPFQEFGAVAHTFLSFGFDDDDYLAISVEVRRKEGEEFSVLKGLLSDFDLMYVVGDEKDLIGLRANYRKEDVYVYRSIANREQAKELFVGMLNRANKLSREPERYNLIVNNCTTNVRRHINRLAREKVPYSYQVMLPGYSDKLAYDLGLIETRGNFDQTREAARVNKVAYIYRDHPDFSSQIRH